MATKYVVAAAAVAVIAATTTEAKFKIDDHKMQPRSKLRGTIVHEDAEAKANWNFNAGIQGGAGGKPQWNAQIGATWEEDEGAYIARCIAVLEKAEQFGLFDDESIETQGLSNGLKQWTRVALAASEMNLLDEEQKLRLGKVINKASRAVNKAHNTYTKAQQVGLLDEEQADWNFNAGIQGGAGGRPQWSAQIGAKWEEDEEQGFGFAQRFQNETRHHRFQNATRHHRSQNATRHHHRFQNATRAYAFHNATRHHGFHNATRHYGFNNATRAHAFHNATRHFGFHNSTRAHAFHNATRHRGFHNATRHHHRFQNSTTTTNSTRRHFNPRRPFNPFEEEQKLRLNKVVKGIKKANNVVNKAQQIGLLDEEAKANWNFNAGINGGAGGKPQWNAQIGATWDEEEQKGWSANAGISGGAGGRPQWNVGVSKSWEEEEEQKLRLKKIVKGIKKVNNVVNRAQEVGLLDEEQADWNFNAGIQGGAGGRPQWNAQIGAKWEEDEEQLVTTGAVGSEAFNINLNHNSAVKDGRNWKEELKKAADLWKQAREAGYFDEDAEQADWNFNAGIQGGAGGRPQWNAQIGAKWDEEQGFGRGGFPSSTGPYNPTPPFSPWDEEQADWNFNAGIQGGAGGKPQWNAQIGAKWEEDEAEQFVGRPHVLVNRPVPPVVFDEQQKSEWGFNAGVSGGAGGKPQWNVGINGKWEQEEEQAQVITKPVVASKEDLVKAIKAAKQLINVALQQRD